MITMNSLVPHVLEVRLSGTVTRDDILDFEKELEPLLAGQGALGFVVHLDGIDDLTTEALVEDIRYETGLLMQIGRFEKLAIVTSKQAITVLVRFVDALLPMIAIRTFRPDEVEAAQAFAKDIKGTSATREGVRRMESGSPSVVAFEIDGTLSLGDVDKIFGPLEAAFERQGPINLLLRWRNFAGFDPSLLGDPDLWAHKVAAIRMIRRYAVVGAPNWMAAMAERVALLMPMEIRSYDSEQEAEAWSWVKDA